MRKKTKRLTLCKETLQNLQHDELRTAPGAATLNLCTEGTFACSGCTVGCSVCHTC